MHRSAVGRRSIQSFHLIIPPLQLPAEHYPPPSPRPSPPFAFGRSVTVSTQDAAKRLPAWMASNRHATAGLASPIVRYADVTDRMPLSANGSERGEVPVGDVRVGHGAEGGRQSGMALSLTTPLSGIVVVAVEGLRWDRLPEGRELSYGPRYFWVLVARRSPRPAASASRGSAAAERSTSSRSWAQRCEACEAEGFQSACYRRPASNTALDSDIAFDRGAQADCPKPPTSPFQAHIPQSIFTPCYSHHPPPLPAVTPQASEAHHEHPSPGPKSV